MTEHKASRSAAVPAAHPASTDQHPSGARRGSFATLTIGAVGIVFGGIGTSPLYALDQLFLGHGGIALTPDNVLGGLSLVVWALTVIVAFKYAVLVLRADNDGEGGLFALYGLLHTYKHRGILLFLLALMLGAGLLFGDGIITPAISVLSALEGVGVASPMLAPAVVPVTALLLTVEQNDPFLPALFPPRHPLAIRSGNQLPLPHGHVSTDFSDHLFAKSRPPNIAGDNAARRRGGCDPAPGQHGGAAN